MKQDEVKIYFISDRDDHDPRIYKNIKVTVLKTVCQLDEWCDKAPYFGYDEEWSKGKLYTSTLLLISLGDFYTRFVIDCICGELFTAAVQVLNKHGNKLRIGHNLKSDYVLAKPNGIFFRTVLDTMLMEQRITLGRTDLTFNPYNLEDVAARRLNKFMDMNKKIRETFLPMHKGSKFDIFQVIYAAGDIAEVIQIAMVQRDLLRSTGQYEWFKAVEAPLISILGDMELEGIKLYEDKWEGIIKKRKVDLLKVENKLDEQRTKLAGTKLKERKKVEVINLSLFGAPVITENANKHFLNYGAPQQVLKFIKQTGLPLPILKEKNKEPKPSTKEAALQQYVVENPTTPLKEFIKLLLEHKEHVKFIGSYGLKFMQSMVRKKTKYEQGYKSDVTGKVHTYFKQCDTDTGRLASGKATAGYYNCQQIPAKKDVRVCFGLTDEEIAQGYYLTTCDLSGAELIIMAALADDNHLYELGADKIIDGKLVEGDLHSPLATKSWRAVYHNRKRKFLAEYGEETWRTASKERLDSLFTIYDSENKAYILTEDFEVVKDKKHPNIQLRTDFKKMGFGVVYGLKDNKGAQTLNIPKDDASCVIKVISNEIPKTMTMVSQAAECAYADGYVTFNCVSNNRRWFSDVIAIHEKLNITDRNKRFHATKQELTFAQMSNIETPARNCRIQGTQADMIKHMMVEVDKRMKANKVEGLILLSVHDELVVKHKGKEFGSDIPLIMSEIANLYLAPYSNTIRMKADAQTLTHWTK